MNNKCWNRKSI